MRLALALQEVLVLDAMERLLRSAGIDVVGRCGCVADLERCLRGHDADIALVDTEMAGDGGVRELVGAARRGVLDGRLVLLAPACDCALARASLDLDVDGVVLRCAAGADVVASLERIAAGDAVFPAGWLSAARRCPDAPEQLLSPRQLEVLKLLAQGMPNEMIADRLFISRNTVKFHVAAIYQRLGVTNRVQAAHALGALYGAA
jgi:DNA-binding NarL/FixJ family response regulator